MEVRPFLKCVDYWPGEIPANKLRAYEKMIKHRQIQKHKVIVNRVTGSTTVEYYSTIPHEWIREELRKLSIEDEEAVQCKLV